MTPAHQQQQQPLRAEELLPFIGRTAELAQARAMLADHRLLTLTGPGGSGKTRLALKVMREEAAAGRATWTFVDLSGTRDLQTVPDSIAAAHGMRLTAADPVAELAERLGRAEHVLLLDNLEQLSDAGLLVADLLGHAPRLRVLATSRATLRVRGEQLLPVQPFPVPPVQHLPIERLETIDSVAFLLDRVRALDPAFTFAGEHAAPIVTICRKLDGLPLALELASPHVRTLGPAEVARRLGIRLSALGDASLDTPARHQTLQATIAWGVDLLSPEARSLLADLATFRGPFGLDQTYAVASDGQASASQLDELVRHTLVLRADDIGGHRFRMLQAVREFALEELGTPERRSAAADRHAAWHLTLAERASTGLLGPDQADWMVRLNASDEDIDGAFDHFVALRDGERCLRLAGAMARAWNAFGREVHGLRRLRTALEVDAATGGTDGAARQRALAEAARFSVHHETPDTAEALALEAAAMARRLGDRTAEQHAESVLGLVDLARGDPEGALARYRRLLPRVDAAREPRLAIMVLFNLSIAASTLGNEPERRDAVARAEEIARATGDHLAVTRALGTDALQLMARGSVEAARDRMRAAIATIEALAITEDRIRYQVMLAVLEARLGHPARALELLDEAMPWVYQLYGALVVEEALHASFEVLLADGRVADAERVWPVLLTAIRRLGPGVVPRPMLQDAARRLVSAAGSGTVRGRLATPDVAFDPPVVLATLEGALAAAHRPPDPIVARERGRPGIDLTPRELEVLGLLVHGESDLVIADTLGIGRKTASVHVSNIKGKLGVESRTAAVLEALRLGLVDRPDD